MEQIIIIELVITFGSSLDALSHLFGFELR